MDNLRNIHQRKTVKHYVKERMMESLITGVPEIVSCESGYRRAAKSFIFLLSTAGFFYQSYVFMESFLKYSTVQNIRIDYPTKFMAPAVTFCNKNRISRSNFCKGLPEECSWHDDFKKYGLYNPRWCKTQKQLCNRGFLRGNEVVYALPRNISHTYNSSTEFLDAYGPQSPFDFFFTARNAVRKQSYCHIHLNGGIEMCKEINGTLIQVPSNGFPYKCATMYSLFEKPNEEPRKLRLDDAYFFYLWKRPQEYMHNKDDFPIYMSVHDPRRLVNPMAEGMELRGGYRYMLSFKMKQRQALPPPYDSNCVDYVSKWKENGGRGLITKKDCLELCKIERMVEKHRCVGKSITYSHRYPICSEGITLSDKVVEKCLSGCRVACDDITYEIAVKSKSRITPLLEIHKQVVQLDLKFRQLNVKRTFMEPKFQNIELLSYIGGFMGLWLGISLVTFIDFLETMADITTFAAMKLKKIHGKKRIYRFPH